VIVKIKHFLIKTKEIKGGFPVKKILGLTVVLLLTFGFCAALYAEPQQPAQKTILDYRDELKLSNTQVDKIKTYLADLEKKVKDSANKINQLNKDIVTSLDKESGLNDATKQKIKETFVLRADITIADLETGTKINKLLTPEQFKKWKDIRKKAVEGAAAATKK
jgi:septal ring factor EnvC (AmiA/AmiB activator)